MPTNIADDKRALDLLVSGEIPQQAIPKVMDKMGIDHDDVRAWSLTKDKKDPISIEVRNKVFKKIADNQPIEDPEVFTGIQAVRFLAKNFNDQDIETQKNFFRKFGYEAESDKYGNLYAYDKDTNRRISIDPKSADLWDITDIFTDLLEGVGVGAATVAAAKLGGAYGATAGVPLGPLGIAGGGLLGTVGGGLLGAAVSTGGAELIRQGISQQAGAREEFDVGRIAEQAGFGLLTAPFDLLGLGLVTKGKSQALKNAVGSVEKEQANALKEAAKVLNVELTPGQLKASKEVQKLEASLAKSVGKIGGKKLRKQIENNKKQIESVVEELIEPKTAMTPFQAGEAFGQNVKKTISERLAPAISTYEKYDQIFKNTNLENIAPNWFTKSMMNAKNAMRDRVAGDPAGIKIVDDIGKRIDAVQSINDITVLRRNIRDNATRFREEPIWQFINNEISPQLKDVRSEAIRGLAQKNPEFAETAIRELDLADKAYAEVANQIKNLTKLKKLKPGVRSALVDWVDKVPEIRRIEKVIDTKDPKRIAQVAKDFPEAFEYLRQGYKKNLFEKMQRALRKEGLNVTQAVKELDTLPNETLAVLYGENGKQIVDALKLYLKNIPEPINPSGTEGFRQFWNRFTLTGYPVEQLNSIWQEFRLNSLIRRPDERTFLEFMGNLVQGATRFGRPAAFAAREEKSRPQQNQGLIPQQRFIPQR